MRGFENWGISLKSQKEEKPTGQAKQPPTPTPHPLAQGLDLPLVRKSIQEG